MPLVSTQQLKLLIFPSAVLVLCLGFALPRLFTVWYLQEHGLEAQATVVEHRRDHDETTCSVVRFPGAAGTIHTASLETCSLDPPPIGTIIAVRYLPERPEVTASSGDSAYFWPLFALLLGLGFFWFHLPRVQPTEGSKGGI